MPLTPSGKKTLAAMKKKYGEKKGESVFYASINKGTLSRTKMEGPKRKNKK